MNVILKSLYFAWERRLKRTVGTGNSLGVCLCGLRLWLGSITISAGLDDQY